MPKSKARKKSVYPPPQKSQAVQISPGVVVTTMVTAWIAGVAWIATYYVWPEAPLLGTLANWNLLIGFVFIIFGVVLSTKWR